MSYLKSSHDIIRLGLPEIYEQIVKLVNAGATREIIEDKSPYSLKSLIGQTAEYLIDQKKINPIPKEGESK